MLLTSMISAAETTTTRPPASGFMVSQPAGEKRTSASTGGRLLTAADRLGLGPRRTVEEILREKAALPTIR